MSQNNSTKNAKKMNGVSPVPNPEPPMILVETPHPREKNVPDDFPKVLPDVLPDVLPVEQPQQGGQRRRCLLSQM